MAETTKNNDTATSNTSRRSTGDASATGGGTNDESLTNTDVVEGAPAGGTDSVSTAAGDLLPFPHTSLAKTVKEGVTFNDLIADVYKEHEKELAKEDSNAYEPTSEFIAARADSQERLAAELRASLKAERTMRAYATGQKEGGVKVRLKQGHTDSGVYYEKNAEIYVDKATAKFLEDNKIAEKV